MISSIYIHIPFCKNICSYCDFCKNFYNENIVSKYLKCLELEVKEKYNNEVINTLYIGGGTPSSLSLNELNKLFSITNEFELNDEYEFTFECNYDDITEELLILLKQNKVNRVSIGIQTFNKKYSTFLGRKIDKKEMINKIELVKKYFKNINLDLMYGFNSESLSELKEDLESFCKLDVAHISTYCLIIEEHTKLFINKIKEMDEEIQNGMYNLIVETLKKHGYIHYEISNFSKEGFQSKHNLTYWNNNEYYGFGLGASGFVNNVRYDNTKSISNYLKGNTKVYEEFINKEQKIKDEVMLNLRKTNGINKNEFKFKYKKNIKDLFNVDYLINTGYLVEVEKSIYIPEELLFISNEIILKILDSYKA